MTDVAVATRSSEPLWSAADRPESAPAEVVTRAGVPPLSPKLYMVRACLVMVAVLSVALLLHLTIVSRFQHASAQARAYDELRSKLATGTAPIGPADSEGVELPRGTPVAFIEIPEIGLEQVIGEGTSASVLFDGPGHRIDTPLPGQIGSSVVFGRQATYGGPFGRIGDLEEGDLIRVTTGQGTFEFHVIGIREEGDPVPPPLEPGSARLVLATADGSRFVPDGVLRVDADLDGTAVAGPNRAVSATHLPAEEEAMGIDTSSLWVLVLWLQALVGLAVGAVWAWHRWGRAQTWIVFLPPLLFVGLAAAGEAARLLPNMT